MTGWPRRIFCDTSFFYACLDTRDVNHGVALGWLTRSRQARTVFYSTWEIVGETITLVRRKLGYRQAVGFLEQVTPLLELVPCDDSARVEALRIFKRFGKDKKLSFCDCLSCVSLTHLLDELMPTATFDAHFKMLGLPVLPATDDSRVE